MFCRFALRLASNHKRKEEEGEYRKEMMDVELPISSRKNLFQKGNLKKEKEAKLTCFAAALIFVGRNSRSQDAG